MDRLLRGFRAFSTFSTQNRINAEGCEEPGVGGGREEDEFIDEEDVAVEYEASGLDQ